MALKVKKFLPRGLLGRSLLIVLVPLVVVQGVTFTIFYGTHLDVVSRRLSSAIGGEIAQTADLVAQQGTQAQTDELLLAARQQLELPMEFRAGAQLPPDTHVNQIGPMDDDLAQALRDKVRRPYVMDWVSDPRNVVVQVQMANGVLEVLAPRKRLYLADVYLFVVWVLGSAAVLFAIAALFLRNQVRAIRRLASAADAFGAGRDEGLIKPEGASEVRQAAVAFNRMQARISRFLTQRTEMLAGVSHDLRTPLTRFRLALAVLPATPAMATDVAEMRADVDEMERMIGGYLAFARGEGSEQAAQVDLSAMLCDVAAVARRMGAEVELLAEPAMVVNLRPDAVRRAVMNLVDNARRHGTRIVLRAEPSERNVFVTVDDDGPGIAPERREGVFRPFESGGGGTGLGLTIARDVARAHGGDIALEQSPLGGLRARVRLPL